jgi:hypothetical protein
VEGAGGGRGREEEGKANVPVAMRDVFDKSRKVKRTATARGRKFSFTRLTSVSRCLIDILPRQNNACAFVKIIVTQI